MPVLKEMDAAFAAEASKGVLGADGAAWAEENASAITPRRTEPCESSKRFKKGNTDRMDSCKVEYSVTYIMAKQSTSRVAIMLRTTYSEARPAVLQQGYA